MRILPSYFETLVLPLSSGEVIKILNQNTVHPNEKDGSDKRFSGEIESESFRISEKLNRPDNFIPMIKGKIEKTSKGSIVFTTYNLMFSTALFVSFWSIVTMLLAIIFLFNYNKPVYSGISLAAFALNYFFTSANFHRKVKITKAVFYSLFTG